MVGSIYKFKMNLIWERVGLEKELRGRVKSMLKEIIKQFKEKDRKLNLIRKADCSKTLWVKNTRYFPS